MPYCVTVRCSNNFQEEQRKGYKFLWFPDRWYTEAEMDSKYQASELA